MSIGVLQRSATLETTCMRIVTGYIEVSGGTKDGRKSYVIFTLGAPSWVVVDSPIGVWGGTEDGRKCYVIFTLGWSILL